MGHCDKFGVPLTAGGGAALAHYDDALDKLLTLRDDPGAAADEAIAQDPRLVMAHVLKGVAHALPADRALLPTARAALAAGRGVASSAATRRGGTERGTGPRSATSREPAAELTARAAAHATATRTRGTRGKVTKRELAHLDALGALVDGRMHEACDRWEQILLDRPDDALAMFAAHQTDHLLGRSTEMRDRVARHLTSIDHGSELEAHYLAMHAFGLQESGEFGPAEEAGRRAVAARPRNGWGVHAVTHVLEMTDRPDEGICWLQGHIDDWARNSSYADHHWCHLARFRMERDEWAEVLRLYDHHMRGQRGNAVAGLVDASSLLWRLELRGVDVGHRWLELVAAWEPHIGDGRSVFDDLHAMMAFVSADRDDHSRHLLTAMHKAAAGSTPEAAAARDVGLPAALALRAFKRGHYDDAIDLLAPVQASNACTGRSRAQRELLSQTYLTAALRCGQNALARVLPNERLAVRR
ncbi:MAG: tetratricopeptide repeat protein [Actinomycetota bacterium]|nr:tetratricopeptide repeat protein [Actinomycetota bacterium]